MTAEVLARSAWLLDIVESLTGVDVAEELISPLDGRWEDVSAYGEALIRMSQGVQGIWADLAIAGSKLAGRWEGQAADAASAFFDAVNDSLRWQSGTLAEAGERYQALAAAVARHHMTADHLLKEVLDTAIEFAVWAAAGAARLELGAGAVLGYGMATYKAAQLRLLIESWKQVVAAAGIGVEELGGSLRGLARSPGEA